MMRVLVADDDPVSRALLSHRLGQAGFSCQQAIDGDSAWQQMQSPDAPRLVILDWNMPGTDGIEVCRRIRAANVEPYVYILLLTGRDSADDVVEGLSAGADDYIRKPFDVAEVEVRLRAGKRIIALENNLIAAREQLRREANTDSLTGLYNRRAVMERIGREAERARREKCLVAAIMVDVDHFKRINDGHGHAAGDVVLRAVAERLRGALRPYDLLGRFGGEEFLAFVSSASLADASGVAERLRQAVDGGAIELDDGQRLTVTCSVGVAPSTPPGPKQIATLIAHADAALYRAKANGRNCVASAAGTPPPPAATPPAGATAGARRGAAAAPGAGPTGEEGRASALLEVLPQVVWVTDAAGSLRRLNRHWQAYTGQPIDQALGGGWAAAVHPADIERSGRARERGNQQRRPYSLEMRIRRGQDGALRWNMVSAVPVLGAAGEVVQWVGTTTDIHDRRVSEERARQLNDALRTIMAHTPVGLWSIAGDGTFTTVEGTAIAELGDGWRPVVGKNVADLESFGAQDRKRIARALAGEGLSFSRRCGERSFEIYYAPLAAESSQSAGVVAVALETTERFRSEQLREAVRSAQEIGRAKSDFLARMSHEIRTPMNGVLGMVEVLMDTELSEEQRHFAHTIGACGKDLVNIIDDILDLSKIEAGKLVLAHEAFDLGARVEDQVLLFAPRARKNGTTVSALVDPDLPIRLLGDPVRLAQVLSNLIGNAQKFTKHGRIVVRTKVLTAEARRVRVRIEVADTGPGIDAALADKLFSPYVQGPTDSAQLTGGTGLGLSICKHLVEAMGGTIGVHSRAGEGATFWLEVDFGTLRPPAEPARLPTANDLVGQRVLVVEDDPAMQEIFDVYLRRLKLITTVTATGAAALETLAARQATAPFDIVIIDRRLPDMDGHRLLEVIEGGGFRRPARVILTTAWEGPNGATKATERGFDGFLAKPIRRDVLWRTLLGVEADRELPGPEDKEALADVGVAQLRVLVAEDNLVNQTVITAMLRRLGCGVEMAGDGRQALAALEAGGIDLVLMDCQMPRMDGFEATRLWRRAEARRGGHVPILALTASAMPADRTRCRQVGMDEFLIKPLDVKKLARTLADVVRQRRVEV